MKCAPVYSGKPHFAAALDWEQTSGIKTDLSFDGFSTMERGRSNQIDSLCYETKRNRGSDGFTLYLSEELQSYIQSPLLSNWLSMATPLSRFPSSSHCSTPPSAPLLSALLQHRSSCCCDLPVCLPLFHSAALTNPVCYRAWTGLIKFRVSAPSWISKSAGMHVHTPPPKKEPAPVGSCQPNVWSSLVGIHVAHSRGPKIDSHIL